MERSNRATIARLGARRGRDAAEVGVEVDQLARAGATLPYAGWL